MKNFSDAIRDGAKKHPHCQSGWIRVNENRQLTTCAAAAAMFDLGFLEDLGDGNVKSHLHMTGEKHYSFREGQMVDSARLPDEKINNFMQYKTTSPCTCPELKGVEGNVLGVIIHLNDHHKMSREAIAEWVETVERKLGMWHEEKKEEKQAETVCSAVANGDCVLQGTKV